MEVLFQRSLNFSIFSKSQQKGLQTSRRVSSPFYQVKELFLANKINYSGTQLYEESFSESLAAKNFKTGSTSVTVLPEDWPMAFSKILLWLVSWLQRTHNKFILPQGLKNAVSKNQVLFPCSQDCAVEQVDIATVHQYTNQLACISAFLEKSQPGTHTQVRGIVQQLYYG